MCAALNCPHKVGLIVHGPYIINYYCPQKVGLIVHSPYMYCQLLSSESVPQCVRPLSALRKWASMCAALNCPQKVVSLCTALICIISYCPQKVGLNMSGP